MIRNSANPLAGLAIPVIALAIWFLNDPLELQGPIPPEERGTPLDAALFTWGLGLVSVFALTMFWYPRVEVGWESVTIRNPLRTIEIPRAAIVRVDDAGRYVRIVTRTRSYRCAGLETSVAMRLRRPGTTSTDRAMDALGHDAAESASPAEVRTVRRPTALELAAFIAWASLGLVVLLRVPSN